VDDPSQLPGRLECTGLYSSLIAKETAQGVRHFAPAVWLWSDNADKQRWIQLPAGATIDTSNPDEWSFPVGTKAWKEFKYDGKRIETRIFQKVRSDRWLRGTYVWNADETAAELSFGANLPVSDGIYHVPTQDECDACHKGRTDRLLGFEAPLLGLPGAQGITLATLIAEGRLTQPPATTEYKVPDDGTGVAAQALPWLHVNCGVSCHNENPNSTGYITGMFLRISPLELQSGSMANWKALTTTTGVLAKTTAFAGRSRIVPGSPEQSLLVALAETRGNNQAMPPIGTQIVDQQNLAHVREWIRRLTPGAAPAVVR
jgi:hypothetical protein